VARAERLDWCDECIEIVEAADRGGDHRHQLDLLLFEISWKQIA
jgi:hypothetical protein